MNLFGFGLDISSTIIRLGFEATMKPSECVKTQLFLEHFFSPLAGIARPPGVSHLATQRAEAEGRQPSAFVHQTFQEGTEEDRNEVLANLRQGSRWKNRAEWAKDNPAQDK